MYFYLYDTYLTKKKYQSKLAKIEGRLTDLGISGRIIQLSILQDVSEIIKDILKREEILPTIVVVGSEKIFCQAGIALRGTGVPLGLIPIDKDSSLAKILGVPENENACDVISSRRLEEINLAKVNNYYFFSSVEIEGNSVILDCQDYIIKPTKKDLIKIVNFDLLESRKVNEKVIISASSPKDGYLEVLFLRRQGLSLPFFPIKLKKDSLFYIKKITIESRESGQTPIIIDKIKKIKTPATIELAKEKLKLIVGKNRLI